MVNTISEIIDRQRAKKKKARSRYQSNAGGGHGGAGLPARIDLIQWLLANNNNSAFSGSTILDQAPAVGSARPINVGQAVLLDGVNDQVTIPDILFPVGTPFRIVFSYDFTGNAVNDFYPLGRGDTTTYFRWRQAASSCLFRVNAINASFSWGAITAGQSRSGIFDISWAGPGSLVNIDWTSLDGTLTRHDESSFTSANFTWQFIGRGNSTTFTQGVMWGVKYYQAGVLVRYYPLEEGSGTIAYDASGNLQHGTLVGGVARTTQNIISTRNDKGYTLSGAVFIPHNEQNPLMDATGSNLQFPGRVPYNGLLKGSHCLYMNGTGEILVPHLTGAIGVTITSSQGTSVPTIDLVNGKITCTIGTIWDINLSDGTRFTCSEGAGDILHDVGAFGVLSIANTASGRKITLVDLSGGTRYGRIVNNTFSLTGVTANVVGDVGTFTLTAGVFDPTKLFDGGFFHVTGMVDSFTNRRSMIKSATTTVLTVWDRLKRDVTGETPTFVFDESWARTQDVFHWNFKNGFTQAGQIKIPARADGSNTDSRGGLVLTNPAGPYHNMAETKIDFTGGVASPVALKYGWEANYVFQQDVLKGNEEAWCRTVPNYSNQIHALRESDFVTYPVALTRDQQEDLYSTFVSRWGRSWKSTDNGPITWINLDSILTANQKAGIDDCTSVIAPLLLNAGNAPQHLIFYTLGKVDMKFGVNDGNPETPLLIGNKTKLSCLNGIRWNHYGAPSGLSLLHEASVNPDNITIFNVLMVLRGSPVIPAGTFPRQEAISITGGDKINFMSLKVRGIKYYNTGFAVRTRSCTNGTEYFSQIRSGGGNGCDARHFNDSCQDWIVADCLFQGGDDGFSVTLESAGVFHARRIYCYRSVIISKNNSAVKLMYAQSANQVGTDITDVRWIDCSMGTWTGATGTIVQPTGVPVPDQAYDSANGGSVFARDNDGTANTKFGIISNIVFDGCMIDSWNGNARTLDLANLIAGAIVFLRKTMVSNMVSWGIHCQNCDNCFTGSARLRFDTKDIAGGFSASNGALHFGSSSFQSNNHIVNGWEIMNLNRAGGAITINQGNANLTTFSIIMETIGRWLSIQGAASSDGNSLISNVQRNTGSAGVPLDNGVNTVITDNTPI